MTNIQLYRWFFIAVFAGMVAISVFFRRRARRSGETIPRAREGKLVLLTRLLFAAPLYLPIVVYMFNPGWMIWAALPLPAWVRWLGAAIGLTMLPLLFWVFSSIGSNISETTLTKEKHRLLMHGPTPGRQGRSDGGTCMGRGRFTCPRPAATDLRAQRISIAQGSGIS